MCFPKAIHLRCTNHIRQTIKEKLREFNIPQHVSKEMLADIFGRHIGSHFESGLADAASESVFISGTIWRGVVTQKVHPLNSMIGLLTTKQMK